MDRSVLSHWKPGKVGSEPVGRYRAHVYELDAASPPIARRDYFRIWVSDELPVPVKFRLRRGSVEREEVLRDARFHVAVPDSVFRLPAGTQIIESEASDD